MKRTFRTMSHSPREESAPTVAAAPAALTLSYVDFYSGIGGWTTALHNACRELEGSLQPLHLVRVGSYDHSDLCRDVYKWNFGGDDENHRVGAGKAKSNAVKIQDMQPSALDGVAQVWMMSPPCQPHTRQHENQSKELDDPRSASFLNLCGILGVLEAPPRIVVLENVVGFESSESWKRFHTVLHRRRYRIGQFVLQPHQVGIPNDRPRFYAVAVLNPCGDPGSTLLHKYFADGQLHSNVIHTSIPELDVQDRDPASRPAIREFLQPRDDDNSVSAKGLQVPRTVLVKPSAWCFDIVTPSSQRSACFTSGYGSYVKGTGSILYDKDDATIRLMKPEEREFNDQWMEGLDVDRLRYFSGAEMARLMGFDGQFSFPPHVTVKQQWKLLGNSLNVRVAARLLQLALVVAPNVAVQDGRQSQTDRES